jgi:hypothetical protein
MHTFIVSPSRCFDDLCGSPVYPSLDKSWNCSQSIQRTAVQTRHPATSGPSRFADQASVLIRGCRRATERRRGVPGDLERLDVGAQRLEHLHLALAGPTQQ